ncbi:NmrA family NAD(P)-binding protein [Sphingomonas sp. MG17]|uniref:NmrA family NAD(P)-binding protein n=1 Tax=Sphingomonas tagetis TaxID=2949092 RepID=A0A9X2HI06_9SPHN|nr:NmrA family NAD(P)-binding protein [Sphingomonas tagetis]MCP3730277.1 NmrA family NAD(P)-binding protein [Sphingomonas tagetis]
MTRNVTVFGATGTTGSEATKALLASGWTVKGATRDDASQGAQALRDAGAQTVVIDMNDRASVRAAADGADAIYFVGKSLMDAFDTGQAIQGMIAAEVAAELGTKLFIYQSALAGNGHGVLSVGSKRAIEERIAELGIPAVIARPASFMDNAKTFFPLSEQDGVLVLAMPLPVDVPQELVSAFDIGRAAAAIADRGTELAGSDVNLIAETLTLSQMADTLTDVLGRTVVPFSIPLEGLAANWPQGVPLYTWLSKPETASNQSGLAALVPQPLSFRDWAIKDLAPAYA